MQQRCMNATYYMIVSEQQCCFRRPPYNKWSVIVELDMHAVDCNSNRPIGSNFTASPGKDAGGVRQCQLDKINGPLFSLFCCPALWSRKAARRTKGDGLVGNTGATTVMQRNFSSFNKVIQCLLHSSHCIHTKHQTVKTKDWKPNR